MEDSRFDETDILARTLYGEARGEGLIGLEAVACVVLNRAKLSKERNVKWWGRTIKEVCLKPFQFSCWNPENPQLEKILSVSENDAEFRLCLRIAKKAITGFLPDITHGATHYHAKSVSPAWARKLAPVFDYRNHLFYQEVI